jgi:hypothetical protein
LTPTFNKTHQTQYEFQLEKPGIMISALERYKTLSREELAVVEKITGKVYQEVLEYVPVFRLDILTVIDHTTPIVMEVNKG